MPTTAFESTASGEHKKRRKPLKIWHFTPDLPLAQAPYFELPFSLGNCLRYLLDVWRPLSFRFILLVLSILIWTWFTPEVERAVNFEWGWMLEIGLRNFIIVLTVAGGLHLFLFKFKKQGNDQRYDDRPLATNSKIFHFRNQVWDNMFWTLGGSVPVGTLFECLLLWAYANGYATMITFGENPVWFIALIFLLPIWSGFHFYWYHRLFHVQPLYKWFHYWHHKNVNTGPWSGHAMHPVEHVGLYSDLLIYLVVASHPVHVIFNAMLHTIGGPTTHCGFEKVKFGKIELQLGDFMHQLHHRFIDCNYGSVETPWDKIFGSFHDGTREGDQYINARRRQMMETKSNASR